MKTEYLMGNGAIALGALQAGVNVCTGYPGTPSSEIIETISKYNKGDVYVEWSVNEKAAMEVAAAASYAGARCIVTMKQVGLNVASDPLMSLAYVGVKGGLVIVSADDPGPISSQTEQDTRRFAEFARIPVLDPCSPEEAFEMVQQAFEISEKYATPVILRPTTRVDHAYASIKYNENYTPKQFEGFVKDSKKWVIFPRLSFANHTKIEERNPKIGEEFSAYGANVCTGSGKKAVFASGVSYSYAKEYLQNRTDVKLCKIATPFPFPKSFVKNALDGVEQVLVIEELSPFIEEKLLQLAGENKLNVQILGKATGNVSHAGENTCESVARNIADFLGESLPSVTDTSDKPALPVRPPVLCAGCPHRASFYAVKQAQKGKKSYFCGDIGCYTLGNAMPLDMVDTCLCMGAGITMAQGFNHIDKDATSFAFVGDSTFFASGMTGVVNAIYNKADMILCVLDNSTTAMTGHQPHPGTGKTMMNESTAKVNISKILEGMGVEFIRTVNPFDLQNTVETIKQAAALPGVKAIIFASPCIALFKASQKCGVHSSCIGCKKCISDLGCPAIYLKDGKAVIDGNLCNGCTLCAQVCPVNAIKKEE